jgi:4-amino-4-deoxy-L-arabinose transferase-like glycosyltransferase
VALVRAEAPGDRRRALLAGGLLLFLPAHIQMSAMVNEEMLASFLVSLALFSLARRRAAGPEPGGGAWRAAGVGLAGGLALLTKLSGALVVATGVLTVALDGLRRGAPRSALRPLAALLLAAGLAGGWFYARNRILYGFFQPHALPAHRIMFTMPPGERSILDYLRFPLATFRDPQLLNPDLLRSVWGSTYATVWFDGHRFFLPREHAGVSALGTLSLVLALLPTAAFLVGAAGGVARARANPGGADLPLLLLGGASLAGYALYTWRNPWFAVVKGTSLLGLSLPFAFYASEVLSRWTRRRGPALACGLALAALALCVAASSSFDVVFEKTEVPGLPWREPAR